MPTSSFAAVSNERRGWDRIALTGSTVERYMAVQNPMSISALQRVALNDPSASIRLAAIGRLAWPDCERFLKYIILNSSDDIIKGAAEWQLRKISPTRRRKPSSYETAYILAVQGMLRV
jgi:hypothetical protein